MPALMQGSAGGSPGGAATGINPGQALADDDFLFGNMHPGDTDAESEAALTTTSTMSTVIPLSTSQVLDGLATEAWDSGEQAQVAGDAARQAAAIAHAASNEAKSACARLRRATDCARTGKAVPASLRPNFIPPPPPDSDHGYHGPGQALAADSPEVAPEPTRKAPPPPRDSNNDAGTGATATTRRQETPPVKAPPPVHQEVVTPKARPQSLVYPPQRTLSAAPAHGLATPNPPQAPAHGLPTAIQPKPPVPIFDNPPRGPPPARPNFPAGFKAPQVPAVPGQSPKGHFTSKSPPLNISVVPEGIEEEDEVDVDMPDSTPPNWSPITDATDPINMGLTRSPTPTSVAEVNMDMDTHMQGVMAAGAAHIADEEADEDSDVQVEIVAASSDESPRGGPTST
jgi:hypothetical protein